MYQVIGHVGGVVALFFGECFQLGGGRVVRHVTALFGRYLL